MNGCLDTIKSIVDNLNSAKLDPKTEVVIAPPYPYIMWTKEHLKAPTVAVAAQDAADRDNCAFTGEVSVRQVQDVGATWVILGHSERRTIIKESDELVAKKTKFALDNGLPVILCIGETLEERKANDTLKVVQRQLAAVLSEVTDKNAWNNIVVAYEPVWAIGTGLSASPEDAQEVHAEIRKFLKAKIDGVADSIRIIYGGSVNGKNCKDLAGKADIDGFLVGGASLKPEFVDIVNANE